jgi:serine/threonine-protein kinase
MAQPRYQVIERIDAGGMAEVFKAEATSMQGFQKLVAIKRVLPSLTKNQRFIRMFLDEAKVSLHLNHTNCVQVFDLGIADGTYFIVMEFIDGTNLKNVLEYVVSQKMQLPVEQVVYIAIEICKGLAHAHNKRDLEGRPLHIVHRDISPPNVLMSREGEIKITDFGLAKAQSQVEQTDPGVVKGKFGYLSPEAANGEGVDLRTDVFAVGILLWEMLMGRRLFLGKSDYETLKQVQVAKIPDMQSVRSDVPHQLVEIIERALAKDINRRYQDARSLAEALADFLYGFGRPVTGFGIAGLVSSVMDARSGKSDSTNDSKINEVVQREINALVSLEEVEDLDLMLADMYDSTSAHDAHGPSGEPGDWENPADWGLDLGMEADDAPSFLARQGGGADTWQEAGLGDLMRPENAQAAAEKMRREQAQAMQTPEGQRTSQQQQQAQRAAQQQAAQQQLAQQQAALQQQQAMQQQAALQQQQAAMQQQQRQAAMQQQQNQAMHHPGATEPTPIEPAQDDGGGGNTILIVAAVVLVLIAAVVGVAVIVLFGAPG